MMCLDDLYNEMIECDRFELYEYYKILCNAYLYKLKRLWDLSDESLRWVNDNIGIELQYGWDYYIPMRDIIFIVCNNVSKKEYFEKIYKQQGGQVYGEKNWRGI